MKTQSQKGASERVPNPLVAEEPSVQVSSGV